jgi:CheY-like chemotaxis protein
VGYCLGLVVRIKMRSVARRQLAAMGDKPNSTVAAPRVKWIHYQISPRFRTFLAPAIRDYLHARPLILFNWPPNHRLLILDVMMPGLSGRDVTLALKGGKETANIPILMLAAKADETDIVVGLSMGADDYVTSRSP